MFTQGWLLLAILLTSIGLLLHVPVAFFVGVVLLLGAVTSFLSDRYCLWGVDYHRVFAPRRAFYGEEITLAVEGANRKGLPLAWPGAGGGPPLPPPAPGRRGLPR